MENTEIARFFSLVDGTMVSVLRERLPLMFERFFEVVYEPPAASSHIVVRAGAIGGLLNTLSTKNPTTAPFHDEVSAFLVE